MGGGVGGPGIIVGFAVGSALGSTEGIAVVGRSVGTELGVKVGTEVGAAEGAEGLVVGFRRTVGAAVGEYVTRDTPAPEMTARPEHVVEPVQPSRIMYVCRGAVTGTVYCTWAHLSFPVMQAAGGKEPVPVSSYTTSTPAAE